MDIKSIYEKDPEDYTEADAKALVAHYAEDRIKFAELDKKGLKKSKKAKPEDDTDPLAVKLSK